MTFARAFLASIFITPLVATGLAVAQEEPKYEVVVVWPTKTIDTRSTTIGGTLVSISPGDGISVSANANGKLSPEEQNKWNACKSILEQMAMLSGFFSTAPLGDGLTSKGSLSKLIQGMEDDFAAKTCTSFISQEDASAINSQISTTVGSGG